jgi:hypothetical protein
MSNVHNAKGWIVTAVDDDVTSKYTLRTWWTNPESGIDEPATFNINADVAVKRFKSTGAPDTKTLNLEWTDKDQFLGYDRFSGSIGGGRIYIKTEKGIKVKGEIVGGPTDGQTFVGAGTWTKA